MSRIGRMLKASNTCPVIRPYTRWYSPFFHGGRPTSHSIVDSNDSFLIRSSTSSITRVVTQFLDMRNTPVESCMSNNHDVVEPGTNSSVPTSVNVSVGTSGCDMDCSLRTVTLLNMLEFSPKLNKMKPDSEWNERHEWMLKLWAEESTCFQKMHDMSHLKYEFKNLQLTLPVIIMSTITGTANFALSSFSEPWKSRIPVIIGSINILSGMITTITQYLRVNEKSEGHRVAALAYGKLLRQVSSELALPRNERSTTGLILFKQCRGEMDRLEEQSPEIDEEVCLLFEKKYGQYVSEYNIARPTNMNLRPVEICSDNVRADIYRRRCSATPLSQNSSTASRKMFGWGHLVSAIKQARPDIPKEILVPPEQSRMDLPKEFVVDVEEAKPDGEESKSDSSHII